MYVYFPIIQPKLLYFFPSLVLTHLASLPFPFLSPSQLPPKVRLSSGPAVTHPAPISKREEAFALIITRLGHLPPEKQLEMQDPKALGVENNANPKLGRKKVSAPKATMVQLERNEEAPQIQGSLPFKTGKKVASKRNTKNEVSPLFQQPEQSNSDSSGNEYRALRKKYLLLEEESSVLGKELHEVEDDVRNLENEKLALLDRLVVLEGLIDPSEMQPNGM